MKKTNLKKDKDLKKLLFITEQPLIDALDHYADMLHVTRTKLIENVLKRFVIDCYKQEQAVQEEELGKINRILGF